MPVAVDIPAIDAMGTQLRIRKSEELVSAEGRLRLTQSLLRHIVVRVTSENPIDPAAISAIARELGDPAYVGVPAVPGHEIIGDFSARAKLDDGRPRKLAATEALHQDVGIGCVSAYSILHTRDVPPIRPMRWASMRSA